MNHPIFRIAYRIQPELADDDKNLLKHLFGVVNIITSILTVPIAILGVAWQISRTNFETLNNQWWLLIFLSAVHFFLSSHPFRIQLGIFRGNIIYSEGSLGVLISYAGALLFGPVMLWVNTIAIIFGYFAGTYGAKDRYFIWNGIRNTAYQLIFVLIGGNAGLWVYEQLGGQYPILGFDFISIRAAISSGFVTILAPILLMGLFFWLIDYVNKLNPLEETQFDRIYYRNGLISVLLPSSITFFGILAAGIYSQLGLGAFLFFLLAAVSAALLANRLSRTNAQMEQRSRELSVLEQMGQAILNSPPETAVLPDVLQTYLPDMLPGIRITIWLLPDEILFVRSLEPMPDITAVSPLLNNQTETVISIDSIIPPRNKASNEKQKGFLIPILLDSQELLGGMMIIGTGNRFSKPDLDAYVPSLQSLASQIASAINRVQAYKQSVASEKMVRELEIAGQIQTSFLPDIIPQPKGWDLAATLVPARQTSGDFYDFVELENGRLAVIVADVADKGTGAALYMALSRTLIRTYIMAHPNQPEKALQLANERILADTKSDQFVTVFIGVLDIDNQQMTYANAGHNPAYLFSPQAAMQALGNTGIPLGMFEGMQWKCNQVDFSLGDSLVVYTDGVTEAQNGVHDEFGEKRLIEIMTASLENGRSAQQIETTILDEINQFVGAAPQFDDITLVVLNKPG